MPVEKSLKESLTECCAEANSLWEEYESYNDRFVLKPVLRWKSLVGNPPGHRKHHSKQVRKGTRRSSNRASGWKEGRSNSPESGADDRDYLTEGGVDYQPGGDELPTSKYAKDLEKEEANWLEQRGIALRKSIETVSSRRQLAFRLKDARQKELQNEIESLYYRHQLSAGISPEELATDAPYRYFTVQYVGIEYTFTLQIPEALVGHIHPLDMACFPAQAVWGVRLDQGRGVWLDTNLLHQFIDLEQTNKVS